MLRNIINTLFGTGWKTEVHQKPIISEADSVKDSISETPIPQLSVEEEIEVLARELGGLARGMKLEIDLHRPLQGTKSAVHHDPRNGYPDRRFP